MDSPMRDVGPVLKHNPALAANAPRSPMIAKTGTTDTHPASPPPAMLFDDAGVAYGAATKTKLLFVVNVDWFFMSHRLPIALEAMSRGYEVHLATGLTDRREALAALGLQVHELPLQRSGASVLAELRTLRRIARRHAGGAARHRPLGDCQAGRAGRHCGTPGPRSGGGGSSLRPGLCFHRARHQGEAAAYHRRRVVPGGSRPSQHEGDFSERRRSAAAAKFDGAGGCDAA